MSILKKRFDNVAIGEKFIYGGTEYLKKGISGAESIDGSHVISFENDDRSTLVESTGETLLRG